MIDILLQWYAKNRASSLPSAPETRVLWNSSRTRYTQSRPPISAARVECLCWVVSFCINDSKLFLRSVEVSISMMDGGVVGGCVPLIARCFIYWYSVAIASFHVSFLWQIFNRTAWCAPAELWAASTRSGFIVLCCCSHSFSSESTTNVSCYDLSLINSPLLFLKHYSGRRNAVFFL